MSDCSDNRYNNRVAECREAARLLGERLHRTKMVRALGEIPRDEYERLKGELPAPLRRRAEHFFTENARVHQGLRTWQEGDLVRFGALVNESGASSVKNYEAGCPEIIDLWEILVKTPGVYGTRFSGGGFGGAVIAIVDPERAESVAACVREGYAKRHPEYSREFRVDFRASGPGVRWGAAR